jgi:uncharacterized membrane protein YvbJ
MHCTKCSNAIRTGDKFCAKCGHPVSAQKSHHKPRAPFSNPAGVAEYAALVALKNKIASRRWAVLVGIYVVAAGFIGAVSAAPEFAAQKSGWGTIGMTYVIGLVVLAIVGTLFTQTRVSSDEYYSMTGSRRENGDHQCIHCGHRGIYVKGEYRTNNRHHSCTKCKSHLFTTIG